MKSKSTKYALLSVYDKTGIAEFAKELAELGYKIISTGGTAKVLIENKIPVIPIEKITGNPESFDGRMKTISFEIEGGILYDRKNKQHAEEAKKLKIKPIDIVVCNLYPFEQTVKSKASFKTIIENIDVGGPTMIRAAAKNFQNVLVVISPDDYLNVISKLKNKKTNESFRKELSGKAFSHLSFYDSQIAKYLNKNRFTQEITLSGRKVQDLRYGENPHQSAAFYVSGNSSLVKIKKLHGRNLSLVNVTDINAGVESIRIFNEPCSVVIKHASPCGIALGKTPQQSLERAIEADPESAFGGIIVLNKTIDMSCAKIIASFKSERKGNIDIVAAPKITKDALLFLSKVRKSMGIYSLGKISKPSKKIFNVKPLDDGFILQDQDIYKKGDFKSWKVVTKTRPTKKQFEQMKLAWLFSIRVKSNTILIVDRLLPITRGIGSGQTSRIRSAKIALVQAGKFAKGAILASDSFFPFDDTIRLAAKYKIGAIIQQGGSVNDKASIEAANKFKIPMVFTGRRAFWH